MTSFLSQTRSGTNPGRSTLVLALAAAALVVALPSPADAGKRSKRELDLVRPAGAADADASGVLSIRTTKRGEKGVLKLRNLDPRTRYEVHDAATDDVLGSVRTDRRGKATLKIGRKSRVAGKKATFDVPDVIEVCRVDDDAALLRVRTDGTEMDGVPAFGFAFYEGADGFTGSVDMFSYPDGDMEGFHLSLQGPPSDRLAFDGELYEYARDTVAGDELPLGVASTADLAGRAFRVVGPDGKVYLRGVLPDLETPDLRFPPGPGGPWMERPTDDRPGMDAPGGGPARPGDVWNGAPIDDMWSCADERSSGDECPWSDDWSWDDDWLDDLGDLFPMMPPDLLPFPQPEREPSRLRLEIANDDGDLTDCGNLDRIVLPEIDWPEIDWPETDRPETDRPEVDWPQIDRPSCPNRDDGTTDAAGR